MVAMMSWGSEGQRRIDAGFPGAEVDTQWTQQVSNTRRRVVTRCHDRKVSCGIVTRAGHGFRKYVQCE